MFDADRRLKLHPSHLSDETWKELDNKEGKVWRLWTYSFGGLEEAWARGELDPGPASQTRVVVVAMPAPGEWDQFFGAPGDLMRVLSYAARHDCDVLSFDPRYEVHPDLPTY